MTNKTAIVFGICLFAVISYDATTNDSRNLIFLGQEGLRLIEWIAFWR